MSLRDELLRRFPALQSLPPHSIVVGGAVRDLLTKRTPADVDIECDAAEECAASLGRTIQLGRGELVVHRAILGDAIYDFSARTELRRRDFTINAIAVDLTTGELSDPYEGQRDLSRGVVRMIAAENFQDDPLRMLRGVRLAVQFGFSIEEQTVAVIRRSASRINTVAAERVTYELHAVFSAGAFRAALHWLHQTALDEALFAYPIDPARFRADDVSCAAAYALVLHDPKRFAARWKWSRELLRHVTTLQRLLRSPDLLAIYEAGERIGHELPALFRAAGRPMPAMPDFSMRTLLTGDEIAEIGAIERGPALGAEKRALVSAQLSGEVRSREEAAAFVKRRSG